MHRANLALPLNKQPPRETKSNGGNMKYDDLRQLREEFNDWCVLLSIDEIASNKPLMKAIERVERSLIEAVFTPQAFFLGAQN
jgi:hypothetical protein